MVKYTGVINQFFKTGCEGLVWVLEKDGATGYDALVFMEAGDHLKIFGEDGSVVFYGIIDPDYQIGWTEYPMNPGHGQPSALGLWIHWTQKGWQPDDWANLFCHSILKAGNPLLRAELTRNELNE